MAEAQTAKDPSYWVYFKPTGNKEIDEALPQISSLKDQQNRELLSLAFLRRRITSDENRFERYLRSLGYYSAKINGEVRRAREGRPLAYISPELGTPYRFAGINLKLANGAELSLEDLKSNGFVPPLETGEIARAEQVSEFDPDLISFWSEGGYPFVTLEERRILVDHARQTLTISASLDTGPVARFGSLELIGLKNVSPQLVARHIVWKEGEPFSDAKLELSRQSLLASGLFAAVQFSYERERTPFALINITGHFRERNHQRLSASVGYLSSLGPQLGVKWEHRNAGGQAQRLSVAFLISQARDEARIQYDWPDFGTKDQDLQLSLVGSRERPEDFSAYNLQASALLKRKLLPNLTGTIGTRLTYSRIVDRRTGGRANQDYFLASLPLALEADWSDSKLDPREGQRVRLQLEPYLDLRGDGHNFIHLLAEASAYQPLDQEKRLILAGWVKGQALSAHSISDVPFSYRLFAGGANSVRGYALNAIGNQLNEVDDSEAAGALFGGRLVLEGGAEIRLKLSDRFELVGFAELARVQEELGFEGRWEMGRSLGIGFRYHSDLGPIRVDLGFPLDRRGDDAVVQLHISLGQAF